MNLRDRLFDESDPYPMRDSRRALEYAFVPSCLEHPIRLSQNLNHNGKAN
jgi:hypothetical protein